MNELNEKSLAHEHKVEPTTVRFANTQSRLIDKVLALSNMHNKSAFFSVVAEYMRSNFNHLDYNEHLDFLMGININGKSKGCVIYKNRTYDFFYERYEYYRTNWVNIRIRGVIVLAVLHYAKNKLNLNIDELIKEACAL